MTVAAVQSILWLPESLCGQLAGELQRLFEDWSKAWGLSAIGAVQVHRLNAGETPLPPGSIDLVATPSAVWRGLLAQALFKTRSDSPVVEGVVRRLLANLQDSLRTSFAPQLPEDASAASQRPGHRGMQVLVEILGQQCSFFISSEQLHHSGRLVRPSAAALPGVDLEAVMTALPVPLVAELGHASLSVTDLLQLAPGDVLVLNEDLASTLRLVSPGSSLALTAHLGATPELNHRAVRWSTHS